jgi:hypothetical protein
MADRPILFSAPMVQALIAGRKTQTRRVAKPKWRDGANPDFTGWRSERVGGRSWQIIGGMGVGANVAAPCAPGDRLWVKEAWAVHWANDDLPPRDIDPAIWSVRYFADDTIRPDARDGQTGQLDQFKRKRSSLFMPRWASRLTLTVTDVRVQRLQDISAYDVEAEGACELAVTPPNDDDTREAQAIFRNLWNSLHGPDAWDANPWVVAISFTVQRGNIDALDLANGRAEE